LRRPYRILIALIGTAVLGYGAYESAKRGLADWTSMRWRHGITGWAERRASPPPEHLQEAITALIDALALTPDDPTLIEHLGIALELRATGSPPSSDSQRLYLARALVYFRKAAALRPTSPHTWANILLTKYRLGQVDDEFSGALRHALDFGPWEPAVQLIVADTGLGAWDRLDSGLRGHVSENLQRAAVRQADALARIATYHRRIDLVCAASFDKMKNKVKCAK
jgi:tetratricopeptide (TPR) repeat protein